MAKLEDFCFQISRLTLSEVELAAAILWFISQEDGHSSEVSAKEIAQAMSEYRLRSSVNTSRLAKNLGRHGDLVKGRTEGSFRIRASAEEDYKLRFKDFVRTKPVSVPDVVVSNDLPLTRTYLQALRMQANTSYAFACFDSCAVMCRRLAESILIDALEINGGLPNIIDSQGNILPFGDLIGIAKAGRVIRLSRTSPGALDRLKTVGDAAAHHRHYITRETDIAGLNPAMSHLLSELCSLARY